jgi:hypothetical protein
MGQADYTDLPLSLPPTSQSAAVSGENTDVCTNTPLFALVSEHVAGAREQGSEDDIRK